MASECQKSRSPAVVPMPNSVSGTLYVLYVLTGHNTTCENRIQRCSGLIYQTLRSLALRRGGSEASHWDAIRRDKPCLLERQKASILAALR
jgi:hypothetical protein